MMARKEKRVKRYRVLNPRGIPQGIQILRFRDRVWYEGDVLEPTPDMNVKPWLEQGFLEELR